jgi:ribonuclease-3
MDDLEARLGVRFRDGELLGRALVHSSAAQKHGGQKSNEQLEFLGDAVLQFIVTEALFLGYPDAPEGQMTRARASVVSGRHLARKAGSLGVGDWIDMGRGARKAGGREQPSILADTMEAIIAAVYLDGGMDAARAFVLSLLRDDIGQAMTRKSTADSKSEFQELMQRDGPVRIEYETTGQEGPPHDRTFTVALRVGDRTFSTGTGKSKKEAEQNAAERALEIMKKTGE